MIDVIIRLAVVAPFWMLALGYLYARRGYALPSLLYVAAGSGLVLVAIAVLPEAGAVIALAGLGAILWLRGTESERRRTSRPPGEQL